MQWNERVSQDSAIMKLPRNYVGKQIETVIKKKKFLQEEILKIKTRFFRRKITNVNIKLHNYFILIHCFHFSDLLCNNYIVSSFEFTRQRRCKKMES